jgi:simple sugar transport system substrate-binding protein
MTFKCSGRSINSRFAGLFGDSSLWLFLNNGNVIGGGQPTLTGPAFIDKSNIDAIAEYAENGTR